MLGSSRHALAVIISFVLLAACGDDGSPPSDASADSSVDSAADAASDGSTDSGADTSVDAAGDAAPDASDAASDASDAASDASDAASDASDASVVCTMDSECPGGFCRPVMGGGMACHPYAAEGDSCGGFTPAWAQERCDPATNSCLPTSVLIADAPGRCIVPATIAELQASPESYRGRIVGVSTSWVTTGPVACTEIACSPSMPCCNSCSGGMIAKDSDTATESVGLATDVGVDYSCTGDECTLSCTVMQDRTYRIIGEFDGTRILVTSIQPTTL